MTRMTLVAAAFAIIVSGSASARAETVAASSPVSGTTFPIMEALRAARYAYRAAVRNEDPELVASPRPGAASQYQGARSYAQRPILVQANEGEAFAKELAASFVSKADAQSSADFYNKCLKGELKDVDCGQLRRELTECLSFGSSFSTCQALNEWTPAESFKSN